MLNLYTLRGARAGKCAQCDAGATQDGNKNSPYTPYDRIPAPVTPTPSLLRAVPCCVTKQASTTYLQDASAEMISRDSVTGVTSMETEFDRLARKEPVSELGSDDTSGAGEKFEEDPARKRMTTKRNQATTTTIKTKRVAARST